MIVLYDEQKPRGSGLSGLMMIMVFFVSFRLARRSKPGVGLQGEEGSIKYVCNEHILFILEV